MADFPIFYDCEASSLDGVPIEVGWAFFDPRSGGIASEGHLIRPSPDWRIEESWSPVAERLHGISRERLEFEGRPVWDIARRMNQALRDRELFSDSAFDEEWVGQIFEAAGLDQSFIIRRMDAEALIAKLCANRGVSDEALLAAKTKANRIAPRTHRAEADARHLAVLWALIAIQGFNPS